jgi:outer membrane protein assembly factor BamB
MTYPRALRALVCLLAALLIPAFLLDAGDEPEPEVRLDTAPSPELPPELHLQWARDYLRLTPAWPDQAKLQFDAAYAPVVLGKTLFLGSSRTDSVAALDTETGNEKWTFTTDGPVRFAPVGWEDRVYFVSDDGYLYCVDAADGALLWKFRGGPSDRKILGNGRLISTWPARGAPVIADGTVYFAAGIWPFMGIFLHALDARTGQVVWTNSGDGSLYIKQPHYADAFAGVAPQGPLVVVGDRLLVPGGRSVPACYNRRTGKLLYYRLAEHGKTGGGWQVSANRKLFVNGGSAFDLKTGAHLGPVGAPAILSDDVLYCYTAGECRAYDVRTSRTKIVEEVDRKGLRISRAAWTINQIGSFTFPQVESMIRAGSRLYLGSANQVSAVELPRRSQHSLLRTPRISWQTAIEGKPVRLLAADGKLFVVTLEGRLYCFGGEPVEPRHFEPPAPGPMPRMDAWTDQAQMILGASGVSDGYCISWGVGTGRLITELARYSNLRILAVEPDARKAAAMREQIVAAGLYGERVAILGGHPLTFAFPPYLASLMVSEDLESAGIEPGPDFARKAFASLRPYGGLAYLPIAPGKQANLARQIAGLGLPGAGVRASDGALWLSRAGPLPGAADWTHEHADAANTRVSRDQLVKAPLGMLWFGGSSHEGILPRHGHGPQPQVIDGRLLIEGVDLLRATDIYTGRILWEARLPGVGKRYNTLPHQPGANAAGSNYVSTPDGIYVLAGEACVRLDPATGRRMAEFRLPATSNAELAVQNAEFQVLPTRHSALRAPQSDALRTPHSALRTPMQWGYVNVCDDYLVGGISPPLEEPKPGKPQPWADLSASKQLVVMNRHTGKLLWSVTAQGGFRHNAICMGGGRLFSIDRLSSEQLAQLKRRGESSKIQPRLRAFDLATGRELWHSERDVFGTWLSYSNRYDVLVEAGRVARDTLTDEPKGMRAYRGRDGAVLWDKPAYIGPAMIHGDIILKDRSACDLRTGAPTLRQDPLTGQRVEWTWARGYGCNTPLASEHLLTFRSGSAAYFDLCHDGGTGNFGGFRAGCTNNLIVAGGLLNAPDYTRNCTCSYQNQTSLALVPMPEAEMWTFYGPQQIKGPVRRVGINLGAPGNRKADDGTLWLEYPSVGGPSPRLPVRITPSNLEWFRRHPSQIEGDGLKWLGASGAKGLRSLSVPLAAGRTYTVRLYFIEPDRLPPGRRRFDVALQGRPVLKDFDISREAGGPNRTLVKEFKGIKVAKELTVTLRPSDPASVPVLCGVEALADGW